MMTCAIASILVALLVLASGYRHAPPESRLRLRWIMAATMILVADMLLQYLTPLALSPTGGVIILHPAFIFGALFGLGSEALSAWLIISPGWTPIATKLLGL